jgi:hypothetical protein
MILVSSLMTMVGLCSYQALANGIRVWKKAHEFTLSEDVAIFFDRIQHDLNNSLNYSQLKFKGNESQLSFSTIVRTPLAGKISQQEGQLVYQIGQVEYSFDPTQGGILRRQANYGQALKNTFGQERLLASGIKSVKFLYYFKQDDKMISVATAEEGKLPVAVLIEVESLEGHNQTRLWKRMVNIPTGG